MMTRAPVETVPAMFHVSLSALSAGTSSLQLLIDLEPVHTGTQDQNLGLNNLAYHLCFLSSCSFWWCFTWACVLRNLRSKIYLQQTFQTQLFDFVLSERLEMYWAAVFWVPSLYGYSDLSRAGDLEMQDLLYSFWKHVWNCCTACQNSCVLWEWSHVPHRFLKVLVCNIVLLLVPTLEVAHYSDCRTAGCAVAELMKQLSWISSSNRG